MTREEIEIWAVGHGFVRDGGQLRAPFWDAQVIMSFSERKVVCFLVVPSQDPRRLGGGYLNSPLIRINDQDLLEGIGIGASFMMGMPSSSPIPVWFSPAAANAWRAANPEESLQP